ncbi:pilus assembly protein [Streptomyces sp. NBC_00525]|nr:TadE family type IV pilus minor pilin [Streptomyces sp. NBC_00525]WUC97726.1 pilus assembly protein [Streptomyces sp. NBC_00525]
MNGYGAGRGRPVAGGGPSGDRGAVTAEAAMVIPVLVAFALALLWALMAASAQIRCVDAARAGARAAARSEPAPQVREAALAAAPDGASVEVERTGGLWRVRIAAPTPGPGRLAVTLRAEAAAAAEDTPVRAADPAGAGAGAGPAVGAAGRGGER